MSYIKTLLTTALIIFGIVGITNWFIDPFAMYWSPTIEGINEIKPEAGNRSRIIKAYRVIETSPEVLLVGNSRIEMGLPHDSKHFASNSVYNQGLPGAKLHMQIDYAKDVIQNNSDLKEIIMSIDFLDFLIAPDELSQQLNLANSKRSYDKYLRTRTDNMYAYFSEKLAVSYQLLFSLDALQATFNTFSNQNFYVNTITPSGFNIANGYKHIIEYEGYEALYKQKLDWLLGKLASRNWILFPSNSTFTSPKFDQLESLISLCQEKNITFRLFINPYHFSYLHAIEQAGYWEEFLAWKWALVKFLDGKHYDEVNLWDFSLINARTTEAIDQTGELLWFWEPAHYKSSYGETIIETIRSNDRITEHGVILTPDNIDDMINTQRTMLWSTAEQWVLLQERLELNKTL
ncbi:hypothetical protein [Thalassotalea fusca]